jgi:hypothetical protein
MSSSQREGRTWALYHLRYLILFPQAKYSYIIPKTNIEESELSVNRFCFCDP